MNPKHQCFQKISPENHFSYVRDRTYGTYVRTDKGDAICPPPPHYKWRGHKNIIRMRPRVGKGCTDKGDVSIFTCMHFIFHAGKSGSLHVSANEGS